MSTTIAVSGKGGVGKTTVAAMIIRQLIGRGSKSVLAVDADPNSCLGLAMGIEPKSTVADIREQSTGSAIKDTGMDRMRFFEYGIQQVLTEAKGFDLLTMGRPEGRGCYCSANNILRKFMDEINQSYEFVVIDNEAGMEHLSRHTTNNVDLLCIVAESSYAGKVTARRIAELVKKLPINVKRTGLIWNKTDTPPELSGIELLGCVPNNDAVLNAAVNGQTIFELDKNNPAYAAVGRIMENSFLKN